MNRARRARPATRHLDLWAWGIAFAAAVLAAWLWLPVLDALFAVPFAGLVLLIAKVDVERFEIPDLANIGLFLLGCLWVAAARARPEGIGEALITAMAAAAFLLVVKLFYRWLRGREGLGWGDVKLAGAGAVWLTWADLPLALLIATMAGVLIVATQALFRRRAPVMTAALPLGALLAPAIWLVWFAGRLELG